MNTRKSVIVLILLLFFSAVASLGIRDNFGSEMGFLNDYGDKMVYAVRGSWLPYSKMPYTEVPSEYPQIATYFFAVPYIVMESLGSVRSSKIGQIEQFVNSDVSTNPNIPSSPHMRNDVLILYSFIFSLLMAFFLALSIMLVFTMRKERKYLAYLMLLPAGLFFAHNRFDVITSFLGLLSIYLMARKQFKLSAFVIAFGFLTKWYLVLFLPVFLAYDYTVHRRINWSMIFTFTLTCILILLPTLVLNGFEGLYAPYGRQIFRWSNQPSLFYIISGLLRRGFEINIDNFYFSLVTLVLQFSSVPLCLTSRINTVDKAVKWCALSVLCFIIFAKINSSQWILWISPLLILIAVGRFFVTGIILLDFLSYLQYPVLFYFKKHDYLSPHLFLLAFSLKLLLLIFFAVYLLYILIPDNRIFNRLRNAGSVTIDDSAGVC